LRLQRLPLAAASVVALNLSVSSAAAPAQVRGNMKDQLIFHYCSKAMKADFKKAGTTPPEGIVAFTCGCVVQKINARASIEQAKAICKAEALQKYPQPERP
jgi:hypothetical protein